MPKRLAILAALAVLSVSMAGCGGDGHGGGATATTSTATSTAVPTTGETSLQVFFFRKSALVPVTVHVPETEAVARAALDALLAGPSAGYVTAIPADASLDDVSIASGVATASFSSGLRAPTRTAQGQIVSTLMQFPTVHGVVIEVDGEPVALQGGSGEDLPPPATSADYGDLTAEAFVFVRTPARDSTVSSPVRAAGTANVFEATFQVEIWSGRKLVETKTVTASSGSGTRGTWSATLPLPSGDVRLLFYEPSADDGSHLHETEVLLHVR